MFKTLALGLCLVASFVPAYSPGTCSGYVNTHDPALTKRTSDGSYFRFTTGGGISIARASSLGGKWTAAGEVLADGSKIDLTGNTDLCVVARPIFGNKQLTTLRRPRMYITTQVTRLTIYIMPFLASGPKTVLSVLLLLQRLKQIPGLNKVQVIIPSSPS